MNEMLRVSGANKTFTVHLHGDAKINAVDNAEFQVMPGECVALTGPSGVGKSSLLRMIYGNYATSGGDIFVRDLETLVNIATAPPRQIVNLRRRTIGFVSQFLRVIPRVPVIELVKQSARDQGKSDEEARQRAERLLEHLNLPSHLWHLPPATFSGGEQQRVNIARGLAADYPLLLLDEPTASLDAANADAVLELVEEKKRAGTAILAIFHDAAIRDKIADRMVDARTFKAA